MQYNTIKDWEAVAGLKWRLIDSGIGNAYFNMAVDEYLIDFVSHTSTPVLRFYRWEKPSVSIGYSQNVNDFLDVDFIASSGMEWVRRITGGEAVLHKGDLTYSACVPESMIPSPRTRSFYFLLSFFISEALRKLGVSTDELAAVSSQREKYFNCFASKSNYEVSFSGKKLVGSAQRRSRGVLLQHGAIMLDVDYRCLDNIFIKSDKIPVQGIKELKKRLCGINDIVSEPVDSHAIKELIIKTMGRQGVIFERTDFEADELSAISKLETGKYRAKTWNREGRY